MDKTLDFTQQVHQCRLFLFQPWPFPPNKAMHLIATETDKGECHICPLIRVSSWRVGFLKINIVDIQRRKSVEIIFVNLGSGASRFTGANVEKAKLVPDDPSNMHFNG